MKRVILICPDRRPALESLTGDVPLALAIYLGKPLIEHAFDGLARSGVTDVLLLASDRPSEVRAYVGDGSAWGVNVRISPESSELSPAEAAVRHASFGHDSVMTLDCLPQAPAISVIKDAESWHGSRATLLPLLAAKQIGAREISPGIWCGLKARVNNSAILHAPCWIGPNTMVGSQAIVGPNSYLESDCVIDAHATVVNSTVGSRTYLGSMTHLGDSVAAGQVLVNWRNSSLTRLSDAFLLSRLDPPQEALSSPFGRLLALLVLILTSPLLLLALFGRPWCITRIAVLPSGPGEPLRTVSYHEMPALPGKLRRWPCLWRVVTGDFSWIGNPPLTPEEAGLLDGEFERLWLQAGPGIFTAPEAEGSVAPWDEGARAHASLFSCQPTTAWKRKILVNGLKQLFN
jgi:acetyltransferase-like isoleucine patch superfamily enzyme